MKKWIKQLLALQEVDLRIRNLKTRLELIPREIKDIKKELQQSEDDLKNKKKLSQKSELDIKQIDSEKDKINSEIQRLESQSVNIKKNNEYKALLNEIDHNKEKISDLETKEINIYDKLDQAKDDFRKIEKEFKAAKSRGFQDIKELEELQSDVEKELESENQIRERNKKNISDQSIISTYERLLKRGKGTPFVKVDSSGICGNCHLQITPQTVNESQKGQIVLCDNCSHLIYYFEE